jgi:hypothetical protein
LADSSGTTDDTKALSLTNFSFPIYVVISKKMKAAPSPCMRNEFDPRSFQPKTFSPIRMLTTSLDTRASNSLRLGWVRFLGAEQSRYWMGPAGYTRTPLRFLQSLNIKHLPRRFWDIEGKARRDGNHSAKPLL